MNDNQRKVFTTVIETGSFSAAARELYVTPQSVSQHVRRLEAEIGVNLLTRTSSGVVPTPAGKAFYDCCLEVNARLEAIITECRAMAGISSRVLRLGSGPNHKMLFFPKITPAYLRRGTDEVENVDFGAVPYLDALRSGTIDLAESAKVDEEGIGYQHLVNASRVCIMAPNNPLARRETIAPADLLGQAVYVYSLKWAAGLRELLARECPGLELREFGMPGMEARERELGSGTGILLLPATFPLLNEDTISVPLDVDDITDYGLVYLESNADAVAGYLACAREVYGVG